MMTSQAKTYRLKLEYIILYFPAPVFIFQWMFDEAQMTADNVGKPASKEQWNYIHDIGVRLTRTFENVTYVFIVG